MSLCSNFQIRNCRKCRSTKVLLGLHYAILKDQTWGNLNLKVLRIKSRIYVLFFVCSKIGLVYIFLTESLLFQSFAWGLQIYQIPARRPPAPRKNKERSRWAEMLAGDWMWCRGLFSAVQSKVWEYRIREGMQSEQDGEKVKREK